MKSLSGINYIDRKPKRNIENPPILILIHGYGSHEEDLFSFVSELPDAFYAVSLQGTRNTPFGGYCWYDINFTDSEKFSDLEQAAEAVHRIHHFVEELKDQENLNHSEVWLCGFSQGGILSYALAINHPELFDKVLCLSAYPETKLWTDVKPIESHKTLDFFVSHGTADMVIPEDWGRRAKEVLPSFNIPFVFNTYPAGHGVAPQNFFDLKEWINHRLHLSPLS